VDNKKLKVNKNLKYKKKKLKVKKDKLRRKENIKN
jgi:hypothetical protein